MRKLLFLPLSLLLFILVACGDNSEQVACEANYYETNDYYETYQPDEPETEELPEDIEEVYEQMPHALDIHGLLSYVEYNGNRAYIFGSMHLGRPYFFPLADVVEQAMRNADIFAFEFDIVALEDFATIMAVAGYMMLPMGTTLADVLPPQTHAHLLDVLDSFPLVDYDDIAMFQPMAASTIIVTSEVFPLMDISEVYSVDVYVLDIAQELGRPIIGLNPLDHEMRLLYAAPLDVQIAAIDGLTDRDTMIEAALDLGLVEAYAGQDMDALLAMLRSYYEYQLDAYSRYMIDVILIQRSIEFAEEIHRLLAETDEPTTFFVTMGIGHMLGDDHGNVFVVLEEMGHTITPLWQ
ncbi:MAG: TraB/GumN family protein [Defluviitaleaceae bacterium]|nr:TraB/GumN family protein [Defluviitaleaceae bacterium]